MRRHTHLIIAALFLLLLGVRLGVAAGPNALHLPRIADGQAPISSVPVTLDAGDNSFVSATLSTDGQCVFVSYIDRDNGNRLLVKQDAGDHLIDVALPISITLTLAPFVRDRPGYVAPGDKQADGQLLTRIRADGARILSLYYTSRDVGVPSGVFKLKRLDIPEPACQ